MEIPMRAANLLLMISLCATPVAAAEFGAPMPEGPASALSVSLAQSDAPPSAEPQKFRGRITEVCQKKGCWLMLEDDGKVARVMMKDHSFAVPRDARGEAVVFGTLRAIELDPAEAKHLAEDAGSDQPLASSEYRIEALSVQTQEG
jgi:hypothetical protein